MLFVDNGGVPTVYLLNTPDSAITSDTLHSKFDLVKFALTSTATQSTWRLTTYQNI
jgi:hypothetical protein